MFLLSMYKVFSLTQCQHCEPWANPCRCSPLSSLCLPLDGSLGATTATSNEGFECWPSQVGALIVMGLQSMSDWADPWDATSALANAQLQPDSKD